MRPRRRSKLEAKKEIFNYPEKILIDNSTYDNNLRLQLKNDLQALIQQRTKDKKTRICVEVGIGNGEFLNEIALREPETTFIGIEVKEERILDALDEATIKNIENTTIIRMSVEFLDQIFNEQQIDTVFMNFPDPWPKKRHTKNRMTTAKFIKIYEKILKKNGQFILKTDNENMYRYTLEQLENSKIEIMSTNENLEDDENNIPTQFEKRYRSEGKPIFQIIAKKQ
ncbi:MAG: tRNA (guanosine(46)-N7)-methyltransferase TrmB [Candidatus Peregrinibacteria bacterium]|nr:tRNA (guanosine(46)-N7)-methyltransferase TrmB [Candidatus Peregrinibacteria bacterium]